MHLSLVPIGTTAKVPAYPRAVLAPIPSDAHELSGSSHTGVLLLLVLSWGFAQLDLINKEDSRISCFLSYREVSLMYDRDKKTQFTDGF